LVLTARLPNRAPTLIVPDEQTWTLCGRDPAADGLRPVFTLGEVGRLLVPEVLPAPLDEALESCLAGLPLEVEVETRTLRGLAGRSVASLFARQEAGTTDAHAVGHGESEMRVGRPSHEDDDERSDHAAPAGHAAHSGGDDMPSDHEMDHGDPDDGNGGHHDMHGHRHDMHGDHGDMMAIVGDPSADGLVMEPIELRFGPLGTPLPGGLAVDVTLDGDVVAEARVQPLLRAEGSAGANPSAPDLLAPLAWKLVIEASDEAGTSASPWRRLAAVETERAVSHLAWLRALGRLLGWPLLIDRCTPALEQLPALAYGLAGGEERGTSRDRAVVSALERAAAAAEGVSALVARSRLLRMRTDALGAVSIEQARHAGLRGPAARASGLRDDARAGDPLYEQLGFEPVLLIGGDARARTLVRTQEAPESLRLAAAALRADADGTRAATAFPAPGDELEGPRGPLRAERGAAGWRLSAAGSSEALGTAAEAMVGAEWSAALVALASFDLSPWRIAA
jgi:hypothetical protein